MKKRTLSLLLAALMLTGACAQAETVTYPCCWRR